jgi:serine/threonine-protein kinase
LVGAALVVAVAIAVAVALVADQGNEGVGVAAGVTTTFAGSTPEPSPNVVAPPADTNADPTTTTAAATLSGNWRGAVSGDQTGFDVVAQIPSGVPIVATVEYPQIGCAGTWSEQSRQGDAVTLTEFINRGSCVTSAITLTPDVNGTVAFRSSYYSQSRGRTFVIYATLQRY